MLVASLWADPAAPDPAVHVYDRVTQADFSYEGVVTRIRLYPIYVQLSRFVGGLGPLGEMEGDQADGRWISL